MPKTLTKTISFAEYLLLPYDGKRTEFVDGEIVEMAEASPLACRHYRLPHHAIEGIHRRA